MLLVSVYFITFDIMCNSVCFVVPGTPAVPVFHVIHGLPLWQRLSLPSYGQHTTGDGTGYHDADEWASNDDAESRLCCSGTSDDLHAKE